MQTCLGQKKVTLLVMFSDFRGCNVHKQGVWDSQMCPVYYKLFSFQGVPLYTYNYVLRILHVAGCGRLEYYVQCWEGGTG